MACGLDDGVVNVLVALKSLFVGTEISLILEEPFTEYNVSVIDDTAMWQVTYHLSWYVG